MIQFVNVNKSYGKIKALNEFNLKIEEGKIIGILGPNGCGKSTMLKMIVGLNKPDSGELFICDKRPSTLTKKDIAYLPEIDYLDGEKSVKDMAKFIKCFYEDWDDSKYKDLVGFLKIEEDSIIKKVSKGTRAKIKLLMTFSRNAKIVLLDEPLSGIDILTRESIIQTIVRDYKEGEQTILISTHEIPETENLFEDVVFIGDGKIKLQGNVEELKMKYNKSLSEVMKEVYGDVY